MWFMNDKGSLSWSTDPEIVTYHSMLQELQLWKGENPTDVSLGIDYHNIFEGKVFAKTELEKVISKYTNSFERLELSDALDTDETEVVRFELTAQFKNGQVAKKIIAM